LAGLGEFPSLTGRGEAEILQPHGFEPGERHIDLGGVDLRQWVGDSGIAPQRGSRVPARLRVDLITSREHPRFGTHRRGTYPGRPTRHRIACTFVADD